MTLRDFLNACLLKINVIDVGGNADDDDINLAQQELNDIIDLNKARQTMIFETKRAVYATAANVPSYKIGVGATWNGFRPQKILRAGFVNTYTNPSQPLETAIHVYTDEEWAQIVLKTLTNSISWGLWYDTEFDSNGWGTINPYPVPSVAAEIALYVPTPMDELTDLDAPITFAPGYRKMLKCMTAVCLCTPFERVPSAQLVAELTAATRVVERSNAKAMSLQMPGPLVKRTGSQYNILTNQ